MPLVLSSVVNHKWLNHQYLCMYMGSAFVVYCTSSVLTLAAIAMDRYRAIVNCFQYNAQSTTRRAVGTVVWIWTQATFSGFPPFVGWGHFEYLPATFSCSVNWAHSPSYTGFIMSCSFLVPSCTMIFCYMRIVQVARDHARRIHNVECQLEKNVKANAEFLGQDSKISPVNSEKVEPRPKRVDYQDSMDKSLLPFPGVSPGGKQDIFAVYDTPGREHNGTFRLFIVILIFFCCWVPYIIVSISQSITIKSKQWDLPPQIQTISAWLALLNSSINPLLYALLSKRFRKALVNLRKKALMKMNVQQDTSLMVRSGKMKSNIRRVQSLKSRSNVNHFENRFHLRSFSMFSIASFAETGHEDEDYIPVKFPGLSPSTMWRTNVPPGSSCFHNDHLLQKPSCLVNEFLEIPHSLPGEPLSPCQLKEKDPTDSSIFIFGNITIKVNESHFPSPVES
ncbi:G-protein coupled receptor 161-like [Pelobates fuscus]|uniref:G-protein coupled receptor 161-like n=1 Tax=Pelobates fuscus TaxID=191477 RepID=UPI002FE44681